LKGLVLAIELVAKSYLLLWFIYLSIECFIASTLYCKIKHSKFYQYNFTEKATKITKTIKTKNGTQVEIDVKALQSVLKNPKYADYPVAVYSIIGPYRSGKSFLLSCWANFVQSFQVRMWLCL